MKEESLVGEYFVRKIAYHSRKLYPGNIHVLDLGAIKFL